MCLCLIFDRAVDNNTLARGFCNGFSDQSVG